MFNRRMFARAPIVAVLVFAMVFSVAPPPAPQIDPGAKSVFGHVGAGIGAAWDAIFGLLRPQDAAAAQNERIELVEERTATAKFFKEPDGTFTAELHAAPIHVKGPDGEFRDIDTDLSPHRAPTTPGAMGAVTSTSSSHPKAASAA